MTAKGNRLARDTGVTEFLHTCQPSSSLWPGSSALVSGYGLEMCCASPYLAPDARHTPTGALAGCLLPAFSCCSGIIIKKGHAVWLHTLFILSRTPLRAVRCRRRRILSPEIHQCRILILHVRDRNFSPRQRGQPLTRKCRYWPTPCHIPAPR